jgi:predicted Fe-Mo cluster-binding NifX family protein
LSTKKIAVATNNKKDISKHMGRCKFFAIYTISPDEVIDREYIENTFTHHRQQTVSIQESRPRDQKPIDHIPGEGSHSHGGLVNALSGCDVVLARGMGMRLQQDLQNAGIMGYVVESDKDIELAIQKYLKGELVINRDSKGCCGHGPHGGHGKQQE